MLRQNAKYEFGLPFARLMTLNDDQSIPGPENIIGGTGPFDFSGVSDPEAVDLKIKDDNDAVQELTVDISAAVDQSAVTVDELVTALTTTFTSLDYKASNDVGKDGADRLKIVSTASPLPTWVQVYGEFAELSLIGQGVGLKFVKFDTLRTGNFSPVLKEDEEITTTDAQGLDTEIRALGYQKGETVAVTDTAANEPELLQIIMGYTYDSVNDLYDSGTSDGSRLTFFMEFYWPYYSRGSNQEPDIVGYRRSTLRNCTAIVGESTHERGWTDGNFTVNGLNYTDASGNELGAKSIKELTKGEYLALNLKTV